MDALIREFLAESAESLVGLDRRLVQFAQNPDDRELLARILRLVHTIKGTCGFLGLPLLEAASHAAETVIEQVRDGELPKDADAAGLVLAALGRLKSILARLAAGESEAEGEESDPPPVPDPPTLPDPPTVPDRPDSRAPPPTGTAPIGTLWAGLPSFVRQLAAALGKKIEVRTQGAETAIDCRTLALIKDPLMHMVRNAADHGLEPPAERAAAGKPETGILSLAAYREGADIVIAVGDDGRGLQIGEIARKAHALGLASRAALARMSDSEVGGLIFTPGLSTAAATTRISGRGIGMDVVRDNIETIGGTIDLHTRSGQGTRFVIRIPAASGTRTALPARTGSAGS